MNKRRTICFLLLLYVTGMGTVTAQDLPEGLSEEFFEEFSVPDGELPGLTVASYGYWDDTDNFNVLSPAKSWVDSNSPILTSYGPSIKASIAGLRVLDSGRPYIIPNLVSSETIDRNDTEAIIEDKYTYNVLINQKLIVFVTGRTYTSNTDPGYDLMLNPTSETFNVIDYASHYYTRYTGRKTIALTYATSLDKNAIEWPTHFKRDLVIDAYTQGTGWESNLKEINGKLGFKVSYNPSFQFQEFINYGDSVELQYDKMWFGFTDAQVAAKTELAKYYDTNSAVYNYSNTAGLFDTTGLIIETLPGDPRTTVQDFNAASEGDSSIQLQLGQYYNYDKHSASHSYYASGPTGIDAPTNYQGASASAPPSGYLNFYSTQSGKNYRDVTLTDQVKATTQTTEWTSAIVTVPFAMRPSVGIYEGAWTYSGWYLRYNTKKDWTDANEGWAAEINQGNTISRVVGWDVKDVYFRSAIMLDLSFRFDWNVAYTKHVVLEDGEVVIGGTGRGAGDEPPDTVTQGQFTEADIRRILENYMEGITTGGTETSTEVDAGIDQTTLTIIIVGIILVAAIALVVYVRRFIPSSPRRQESLATPVRGPSIASLSPVGMQPTVRTVIGPDGIEYLCTDDECTPIRR